MLGLVGWKLIMQEIGHGSWFCELLRVTHKALDILGAFGCDRLRVMVEVGQKTGLCGGFGG